MTWKLPDAADEKSGRNHRRDMQRTAVELLPGGGALSPQELALAELIVTTLSLETRPAEIDPDAPLYGAGLGLDSIDILEIALAVSKAYGIRLRSDDENNQRIFSSLRSLNQHIQQMRAK
jgi:acyl carrier protein